MHQKLWFPTNLTKTFFFFSEIWALLPLPEQPFLMNGKPLFTGSLCKAGKPRPWSRKSGFCSSHKGCESWNRSQCYRGCSAEPGAAWAQHPWELEVPLPGALPIFHELLALMEHSSRHLPPRTSAWQGPPLHAQGTRPECPGCGRELQDFTEVLCVWKWRAVSCWETELTSKSS